MSLILISFLFNCFLQFVENGDYWDRVISLRVVFPSVYHRFIAGPPLEIAEHGTDKIGTPSVKYGVKRDEQKKNFDIGFVFFYYIF